MPFIERVNYHLDQSKYDIIYGTKQIKHSIILDKNDIFIKYDIWSYVSGSRDTSFI